MNSFLDLFLFLFFLLTFCELDDEEVDGGAEEVEENEEEVVTDAKSMYYGDEKTDVTFKKAFLPSAFRNIGEEEWAFGFEGIMHREYENTGVLDKYYWTDYKKDISANKKIRVNKR